MFRGAVTGQRGTENGFLTFSTQNDSVRIRNERAAVRGDAHGPNARVDAAVRTRMGEYGGASREVENRDSSLSCVFETRRHERKKKKKKKHEEKPM